MKVEVENKEIALRNSHGDVAIIPAKDVAWVKSKLAEGCHSCLDEYIDTLPMSKDYAEDGTVDPGDGFWQGLWHGIKRNANPKNWGKTDYSQEKDFGSAYKKAKTAGETEFTYRGKRYNTDYAGSLEEEMTSYFPDYNVIFKESPANYTETVLKHAKGAQGVRYPHAAAKNILSKKVVDFPLGGKSEDYYVFDGDTYYAVKLPKEQLKNFDELSDKLSPEQLESYRSYSHRVVEYDKKNFNCADAVCRAFGLDEGGSYTTPRALPKKIAEKFPIAKLTSRSSKKEEIDSIEYQNFIENFLDTRFIDTDERSFKQLIDKYWGSKPNTDVRAIQAGLAKAGYKLPNSTKKDGSFDGVWGPETEAALNDWKKKN